jgi:hypothetical protein
MPGFGIPSEIIHFLGQTMVETVRVSLPGFIKYDFYHKGYPPK